MYKVYWEGDFQVEFESLKQAREYVRADIKGTSEAYGKSQKWIKEHFTWEIEKE